MLRPILPTALIALALMTLAPAASAIVDADADAAATQITWSCARTVGFGVGATSTCNSGWQYVPPGLWTLDGIGRTGLAGSGTVSGSLPFGEVRCTLAADLGACTTSIRDFTAGEYYMAGRFDEIACATSCPWSVSVTLRRVG